MAETNPYRIEEEKWTPNSVYEILPPNTVSWTNYQYSEGSDNVDSDKAHSSLLSGVVDFFGKLLGGVGKILGGAIEAGVGVLGGIVQGVTGLIGGIASAIGSIFGGGNNTAIEPPEPVFNPIKTNLEGAIQPHLDDIEEAKGKIEAAQQEQESIKEDIAAHGRDLSTALSKADKGIADAKAAQESANQAISDVETKSGELSAEIEAQRKAAVAREDALKKEINPKIEAAQSKGDNAMTEAEKAVGWLKNPVEIGSSLIALDVETKEPHYMQWAGTPATSSTTGLPFTRAVRVNSSTETRRDAPADMRVPVKVSPDLIYKWSVWVYSNKTGTEIGFLTTSDSIGLCVEETTYKSDGRTSTSEEGIFVKDIPTGWSKHEGTIKFKQATDNVSLYAVEWNKTEVASTQQYFAALDIVPDVPTQASVDEAQNEALRAHSEILRQQREINALNTAFQEEQKVINATKNELDTLQGEAIKANSKVGETNSTAIEALKAAVDSVEQLIGLDNAYKTQQEEIDRQQNERQELLEEIQKLQGQMIPRTILYENSGTVYDDYIEISSGTLTAKGTWVGELILTRNYSYAGKGEDKTLWNTVQRRFPIPWQGSRKIINLDTGSSTRADYWVYPGVSKVISLEGPSGYVSGATYTGTTWGKIHSFTMPENTGKSTLRWETRLLNADRGLTYRLRVLVNGTPERTSKWSGKGPMFPWGSGVDYLRPVWNLEIPTGATVTIEGSITGSGINSTRAEASHNKGTLTWIEMPKGEE